MDNLQMLGFARIVQIDVMESPKLRILIRERYRVFMVVRCL